MSLSLFIGGVIFHTVELDSKSIIGERGVDSSRTRISLLKKKKKPVVFDLQLSLFI